jgi:hypothetical protein
VTTVLWTTNKRPLFSEFSNDFELYLNSNSSNATIVYTDSSGYGKYNGVTGESCVVTTGETAYEIMDLFDAKVLFYEKTDTGLNYYCYSKRIKYQKSVNGVTVNLQISVSDTQTKIGSPMIFGSF